MKATNTKNIATVSQYADSAFYPSKSVCCSPAAFVDDFTFGSFTEQWMESRKTEVRSSTLKKYRISLNKYLLPAFRIKRLQEITPLDLDRFQNDLILTHHLSPVSVGQILTVFKMIYRFGFTSRNMEVPALRIRPIRKHQPQMRVLTRVEQKKLCSYLLEHMNLPSFSIYLALTTGLRLGELCALRWKDIRIDDEVLMIHHSLQRVDTPEDQSASKTALHLVDPKTDTSRRLIPLTPKALQLCIQFQQPGDIFLTSGSCKPMDPRTLQNHFYRIARLCGIENVHFHTLRHTFATRCVEESVDIKCISEILGNSSVRMTLEKYVHISLEVKKSSIRQASGAFE